MDFVLSLVEFSVLESETSGCHAPFIVRIGSECWEVAFNCAVSIQRKLYSVIQRIPQGSVVILTELAAADSLIAVELTCDSMGPTQLTDKDAKWNQSAQASGCNVSFRILNGSIRSPVTCYEECKLRLHYTLRWRKQGQVQLSLLTQGLERTAVMSTYDGFEAIGLSSKELAAHSQPFTLRMDELEASCKWKLTLVEATSNVPQQGTHTVYVDELSAFGVCRDMAPFETIKVALSHLAQIRPTSDMYFDSMRRLGRFTVAIEEWLVEACPFLMVDDQVRNFDLHLQLEVSPRVETRQGYFALQKHLQTPEGCGLLLGPDVGPHALARCFTKLFSCTTPKVAAHVNSLSKSLDMILGACSSERKQEWLDLIGCTANNGDVAQQLLPVLQRALAPTPKPKAAVSTQNQDAQNSESDLAFTDNEEEDSDLDW